MADKDRLRKLVERINATSNADFVKRLLDKKRAVLKNVDGTVSTHELAYVDVGDGNAVVYPEVQSSMYGLMRYPSSNAYDRAVERGDTLHMSVPDAELFTTGYKDYYPGFDAYACGGKKYPGGGKFFRTNLRNEAPLMYEPMVDINYPVVTPMRFRPQPDLGDYSAPESVGMAESFPVGVSAPVVHEGLGFIQPEVSPAFPAAVSLFSDEAKARRKIKQRYAESKFNDRVKSHAGAMGAWQIMPITYKDYLGRGMGKAGDLNDPKYNEKVRDWAMGIIPRDLKEFWSDDDSEINKLAKLYAAYNWGAGSLRNYLRKRQKAGKGIDDPYEWVEELNPETKRYVKYLVFDEDFDEKTGYTTKQFEDAARARGYMAEGGRIHIKPSHRGRLTELKARTGKSEAELYNDGNPAHRKMVVFARNARKWNHADGGFLKNYFEQGGPEKQNWFTRATLGAMMADNPAVATASGWTRDPQGNVEQNSQQDPGVEKLRNNLSVIAGTSFAAPLLASAPGMAVNWLSNPANQMVAGKFMAPLLGAGAFDSAMKKYTPYSSWGNALGNTLGVYDNPFYQYGLGDFGKGLVNNAMEFTNPAFFAPYDNLSKNISGLYDRGMGYLRNIRRPVAPNANAPVSPNVSSAPVQQVPVAPAVEAPVQDLTRMSLDDLRRARYSRANSGIRGDIENEIRTRIRSQYGLTPGMNASSLSNDQLAALARDRMGMLDINLGLGAGDASRIDVPALNSDVSREIASRIARLQVPRSFQSIDEAAAMMRFINSSNTNVARAKSYDLMHAIAPDLKVAIANNSEIPIEFAGRYDGLIENLINSGKIKAGNRHYDSWLSGKRNEFNTADTGVLQSYLKNLGVRASDNSETVLEAMKNDRHHSLDELYGMLRNYDTLSDAERKVIQPYIDDAYGRPAYYVPHNESGRLKNEALESRLRSMLPENLRDNFRLENLYDPYSDGYVETAEALRKHGLQMPGDIDFLSWFQVKNAADAGADIRLAKQDAAIQEYLLQRSMPRQTAIAEDNRSPQSLLVSYKGAVRSPGGYGTGPGQTSIVELPYTDLEWGNNYQMRRVTFDANGNMHIGDATKGAEENFFTKDEMDNFVNALIQNGADIKSVLQSNPEFVELSDKLIRLSRAMNQADQEPIAHAVSNINRRFGENLTTPPLDIYANTSDASSFWSDGNMNKLKELWQEFVKAMQGKDGFATYLRRVPTMTLKHKYGGLIDRHSPESLRKAIENIRGKKK